MERSVVLREVSDALGQRQLHASLTAEGDLLIEGLDSGDGVEQVFGEGFREYEWKWRIPASQIPKLLQALGESACVLAALGKHFSGENAAGLKQFLDSHEIEHEAWSRMGD